MDQLALNSLDTRYLVFLVATNESSRISGLPTASSVEGGSIQHHTAIDYVGDCGFEFFQVTFCMKKEFGHQYF